MKMIRQLTLVQHTKPFPLNIALLIIQTLQGCQQDLLKYIIVFLFIIILTSYLTDLNDFNNSSLYLQISNSKTELGEEV